MEREKWSSLVWLAIGVIICIGGYRLSLGTFRNPGPGFLPFITGLILGSLSFVLFLQAKIFKKTEGVGQPFFIDKKRAAKGILTLFAVLAYSVGMDYLGFIVSTIVFLMFLSWLIAAQRWYIVIFSSVSVSLLAYVIFEILLNSRLPNGIFER